MAKSAATSRLGTTLPGALSNYPLPRLRKKARVVVRTTTPRPQYPSSPRQPRRFVITSTARGRRSPPVRCGTRAKDSCSTLNMAGRSATAQRSLRCTNAQALACCDWACWARMKTTLILSARNTTSAPTCCGTLRRRSFTPANPKSCRAASWRT